MSGERKCFKHTTENKGARLTHARAGVLRFCSSTFKSCIWFHHLQEEGPRTKVHSNYR